MNKGEETDDKYNKPMLIGKIISIVVMCLTLIGLISYLPKTTGKNSDSDKNTINIMIAFLVIIFLFYIINLIIGIVYYNKNTDKDKNMSFGFLIATIIIIIIFLILSVYYISHIVYSYKNINTNIADAIRNATNAARKAELDNALETALRMQGTNAGNNGTPV
jgi:amino acid permease